MRKLVMSMMTTLDGRLDDPDSWVTGIPDDLYAELDRLYATFDTILVGRSTYEEMLAFWPAAEAAEDGSAISRSMARKMNSYKKYVLSGASETTALKWKNAEQVLVGGDDDLAGFVAGLKHQPGADIHLSGGARLAQTLVRLGLVDRYHLVVHPVASRGSRWFDGLVEPRALRLLGARSYSNGAVGLSYEPVAAGAR